MTFRGYRRPDDVVALQDFTADAIARAGQCGYLHVGDVPHRIFNAGRNEDVTRIVGIWEDRGTIVAWALVQPNHPGFDAQVDPDVRRRRPELETEVIVWAETRTWELLQERGSSVDALVTDAFDGDDLRIDHLKALGWAAGHDAAVLTMRSLASVPEPVVPDGHAIRPVSGVEEAEAVAEVHSASFGSTWLPGQYRSVMESPGYDPHRELVAVAPDGSLAGFTVMWFDERNGVGLFEPVGVHHNHRRRGLGAALLGVGMGRMRDARLSRAMVMYEESNPASGPLYRGMGFEPAFILRYYSKPFSPES